MATEVQRLTKFNEYHWGMLLDYIAQGRVVPVLGQELLVANHEGAVVPFYQEVSRRLARYFDIPEVPGETINDFLSRFLIGNNTVKMARIGLLAVLEQIGAPSQPALQKLASINAFRLFLTTTPDSLLTKTLSESGSEPEVYFYYNRIRSHVSDLPDKKLLGRKRYVYHLYGRAVPCLEYAISEDDRLYYSCKWMDSRFQPRNLLSYLADKYLLILGCGYENWQARFFLFGLKGPGLFSNIRDASGLLADSHTRNDSQLDRFLSRCKGNVYYEGGAIEFVDELSKRLHDTPVYQSEAVDFTDGLSERVRDAYVKDTEGNGYAYEKGGVFISYAKENREIALKIKRQLESFSIPVWLDKFQLESGTNYGARIERNIRNSTFFLPILSQDVAKTLESRYFRKEWNIAIDESLKRAPKIPFIHPVAVDDVTPCDNILEELNKVHWIYAPGGELPEHDIDRLLSMMAQV